MSGQPPGAHRHPRQDTVIKSAGDGQLNHPRGIAVSGEEVFVVELNNHRVQVFGLDGTYRRQFGEKGAGEGQFNCPTGIAVSGDEVFVVDPDNLRVQVFR